MKHADPTLTTAESYAKSYDMPLDVIERLIAANVIR